jgi:hypothetical protein
VRAALLPRRLSIGTLAAAAVVLAALVVAFAHLPGAVRELDNRAAHNARQTPVDRDLEVTRTIGISTDFVLAAERILPPDATYVVDTGPAAHARSPLVLSALPGYLQNLLLPRLAFGKPQWLLCYGCDLSTRPVRNVVWRQGPLAIARLAG